MRFYIFILSVVSEVLSSRPTITINIKDNPSVLDVARLMSKNRLGSVIMIKENNKPLGIITERDILKKVSAENRKAQEVAAAEIMSSPVLTIKAIDSIDTAAEVMTRNKVKRLIVLEQDDSIVGVLSVSDIIRKLGKILADDYNRYRSLRAVLDLQ
jgi:signal-transduction protein with cAMP-binding, CBS, and nucleotidyltransferase domain